MNAALKRTGASIVVLAALLLVPAVAQDLTPRAYWPTPRGSKVLSVGYSYRYGDTLTDPTLPVSGVDSGINVGAVGYVQTFALAGRTASLLLAAPYSWGSTRGEVEGEFQRRDFSGLGDSQARLMVNLRGAPTMDLAAFEELRRSPRLQLGASFDIRAPTGDYDPARVLNLGANRWAGKPAIGLIYPIRPRWLFEAELGVWFFGDNDDFVGKTREQSPIGSTEMHLIHRIRPGFWAAIDVNFYAGGRSTVDGEVRDDRLRNSRVGATLVFPFRPGNAVKASYSHGVVTSSGEDFDTVSFSYVRVLR